MGVGMEFVLLLSPIIIMLLFFLFLFFSKFNPSNLEKENKEKLKSEEEKLRLNLKLENLEKNIESLIKRNNITESKLYHFKKREEYKREFRHKLTKFTARYVLECLTSLEKIFKEKGVLDRFLRDLDEFEFYNYRFEKIRNIITKKGMDDYDGNNFAKIGIDNDGTPNPTKLFEYAKEKPREFITEIRKSILEYSGIPLIVTKLPIDENSYSKKIKIVEFEEFVRILEDSMDKWSEPLQNLYVDTVLQARILKGKEDAIREGICNEEDC